MTAAEHQNSELRPNEHPTFTRVFEGLMQEVPASADTALRRARQKLARIKDALDRAYLDATENDFLAILDSLGRAYREVARLESEALK